MMSFAFLSQRIRALGRSFTPLRQMRMPFVFARQRFRRMADLLQELAKSRLDLACGLSLVDFDEVGHAGLQLERAQRLLDGLIVDVRKKVGGFNLALLHIGGECRRILHAGVADAMLPDGVYLLGSLARHALQVGIEIAVEVGFEYQILRPQMLFARRRADEHHVVHHHQASQVSAGDFGKRAAIVARQIGQKVANGAVVRYVAGRSIDDGCENREPVDVTTLVWHGSYPLVRSEERRGGKEWRSRWSAYH